ncbi:cytochrome d ubiquinol oxidase subunit II [Sulfobacillus thermosulfidooxidans]|uniref:cytochrome d ubiquinol oxidase subunit II n=1 Tax=Sulfobacillus thermosulfidooxidans TaxID=28034 RepID=UPI0006B55CA8|nr:cytochrome d ubiquinol oxidase subunit II [Sulfobacillus thermosulfidooxidans]
MLNVTWFVLAVVLFIGYFFLEGFDYGVGMLLPVVGRNDHDRRLVLSTIGPFWDGNEVWLIASGGSLLAAFPAWYASFLSSFYLAFFFLLAALIVRGVAIEFRSRVEDLRWRQIWDSLFVWGSFVPPLVWGFIMANMVRGIPIDAQGNFVGSLLQLVNVYSILGAISVAFVFALHGALFLMIRTKGVLHERAEKIAYRIGPAATGIFLIFVVMTYYQTDIVRRLGLDPGPIPVFAFLSMIAVRLFLQRGQEKWAFVSTGFTIILSTITIFLSLYPDVMISSLNPSWNLTIYNAAANPYSLHVMTIMTIFLLPIVLGYQAWSYWVFRKRIDQHSKLEY